MTLTDWLINFLLCKHTQTDFWDAVQIFKLPYASGS